MYDWLSTVNDEFWLIFNYSKVVWDIDTKLSPDVVLISFQLFTKFEGHNSVKKTAMPLGSSKWKWAWRAHFLSHTYETQKICCFLADVQIILVSLFEFFDYIKVANWSLPLQVFRASCSVRPLLNKVKPSYIYTILKKHHLPRVSPKQLCALAYLSCTR